MKNIDKVREMAPKELVSLFSPLGCPPGHENTHDCDDVECDWCWICWLNREAEE